MEKPLKILFAEDSNEDLELISRELTQNGIEHNYINVITPEKFIDALHNFKPDIIISDLKMPSFDGIQSLQYSLLYNSDIPFIMLTGSKDEETAVKCMKAGATDYILKDRINMLPFAVKEALQIRKTKEEKRIIEKSLQLEEKKYRLLFENMSQGVIFYSSKTEILSVNPAAEKILNLEADRIKGMKLNELKLKYINADGEIFNVDKHPVMIALKGKRKVNNVILGITKPNKSEVVWIEISAVPQFEEGSNIPQQVFTTFEDITEIMKNQSLLKENEIKYRSLFEYMTDAFILFDLKENEITFNRELVAADANKMFENIFNYKHYEIKGKIMSALLPSIDTELTKILVNVVLNKLPVKTKYFDNLVNKYFEIKAFSPKENQVAIVMQFVE